MASAAPLAASLGDEELRRIADFEKSPRLLDVPDFARAEMEPKVHEAYREARALFAGRGTELARHFLTHTDFPPSNSAWYFVLEAVGDADAAVVLIRALWDPPAVESGPPISAGGKTWLRERDTAEIHWAIASVLVNQDVSADAAVLQALQEALGRLRPERPDLGPGDAARVVELMGLLSGEQATEALRDLASDRDPAIRSLALQGLGQVAGSAPQQVAITTFETVSAALRSDPDPRGRIEAAAALAKIGSPEVAEVLRQALASERYPTVVDAIVSALEDLDAPWRDPALCGEIAARTWETSAARAPFACWRAGATAEELLDAAVNGPGNLRVLALYTLAEPALAYDAGPPLALLRRQATPPPPPAPAGAKAAEAVTERAPPPVRPTISFDESTQVRLLDSIVERLSRPSGGLPGPAAEISSSTVWLLHEVLWEIAQRDLATALRHADRIATAGMRYTTQGRYGASHALWRKDPDGYIDHRRPRQAAAGALCAAAFAVLLGWRRTRRAGLALVAAALAWAAWSLFASEPRDLPPPPLQFLTSAALAFGCAGVTVAGLALTAWPAGPRNLENALGRIGVAVVMAALLAFFVCGYTRWYGLFPIGGEGWELIFDPLGSAVLAGAAAFALALLDSALTWRLATRRGTGD